MSYLVLARKYRPRTFDEVIGQEVVVRVLCGALKEGRVGHAYLFAGARGTGKTTLARILAKALNCEEGPTPSPCGRCARCQASDAGTEADVIELDAASHTGVDKIRELREEASYAPLRARNKVYIIDEVHMLSKAAFNALLKTLEEPPPRVVFLLATTEPHKVLDTILSRCQVLRLNPLAEEAIAGQLERVLAQEGVRPGEGVVRELARGARGGMRDALSQADRLLALAGDEPTLEDLARLGGDGGTREVDLLLDLVEGADRAGLLRALGAFEGGEGELLDALLARLRACVVLHHCGEDSPLVAATEEERRSAGARAKRLGAERLELMLQELLRARERMRILPGQEGIVLEVALLDLARPETTVSLAELETRLAALARDETGGGPLRTAAPAPRAPERTSVPPAPAPAPAPVPSGPSAGRWERFLAALRGSHGALADLLARHGRLEEEEDGSYTLVPGRLSAAERRLVEDRRNRAACARLLGEVVGGAVELRWSAAEGEDGGPPPARSSPRAAAGEPASRRDAFTSEVADLFGGIVEEMS
ncbi:MAG: DNA polymerase III subunit gamma/tau [Planctomycetota bacterium]